MKKTKELLLISGVSFFAIFITLAGAELVLRIRHHKPKFHNYIEENWNLVSWEFPVQHDPYLGWIPKPNKTIVTKNSQEVLILLDSGIRSNGDENKNKVTSSPILAVGASTVFGSQVSDKDTWPAILEKSIQKKVVNGAVFAYGFDQIILRMENLITKIHPERVIIGIHPDNLAQTAMSQKYGKKPYFEIVANELILKNTPVPETKKELKIYQATLGYSYLIHYLMSRLMPQTWLENHGEIRVHNQANEVSCLLVKRAAKVCEKNKIHCSVLFQYFHTTVSEAREQVNLLNSCIKTTQLQLWDSFEELEQIKKNDPVRYKTFFDFHMTPSGNAWVANYIAKKIRGNN